MQVSIILLASLALLGVAYARPQYTYPRPTTTERPFEGYRYPKPAVAYLPPPPPPTPTVYVSEKVISPVAVEPEYVASGAPYDFTYSVKDSEYQNDYARNEQSDGEHIKGEYRTLLPDGRTQVVQYTADWKNGYNAVVTYIGQARYQ